VLHLVKAYFCWIISLRPFEIYERRGKMASIPKKVSERFKENVPKYQKILQNAQKSDLNESDTVSILIDMFGNIFGYDRFFDVTSEYAVKSTYCDLALKIEDDIKILVEAKAVGKTLNKNHLKQALNYGANKGISWIILTNSINWQIFKIRFEKPIDHDLVFEFNLLNVKPRDQKHQDLLYMISKEGLAKKVHEKYYERFQCINRYVIGQLMLSDPYLKTVQRDLKKISDGLKIDTREIEEIIRLKVLKRDLLENEDQANAAKSKIRKLARRSRPVPKKVGELTKTTQKA